MCSPFLLKIFITKLIIMCFIKKKKSSKPFLAEKDIVVFKVLSKGPNKGEWISPIMGGSGWIFGKKYKLKIWENEISRDSLNVGFHSYRTPNDATSAWKLNNSTGLFVGIIPKGTRYYENDSEYCSQAIILLSFNKLKKS